MTPKKIEVISGQQKLIAYEGQRRIFEFDCVLGDDLTPTRRGHFRIGWKDPHHISSQSGHPMPYAMFFDGGRAIHAGVHIEIRHLAMRSGLRRLDALTPESLKIGSHGCVNLGQAQAKQLYDWAPVGTPVEVH